ncbi:MAG: hypothetical protein IT463_04625 [Planctomycetes bacterium]|nr:hypothetical protein [Planctomycetota bacterium]
MTALRTLAVLVAALVAAPLFCQESFSPYMAGVTGDSVRLRSGPSLAHPPVYVLAKGEQLVVVGHKDGWAEVQLPANAPCWLAEQFAKLNADGKSYTVTGDKVNLRCTPDTKYFAIGQIGKDRVLAACLDGQTGKPAAEGGFVRVIPPAEAHGAVSLELVEKLNVPVPAAPVAEAPKADAPVAEAPKAETPVEAPKAEEPKKTEEPKREPSAAELEDEKKTFAELERLLADELKKPAVDVNLTNIRKMFEQFKECALDAKISEKAVTYIEKIDVTVKLIEAEKARLAKEDEARKAEIERLRKEALEPKKEPEQPKGPVEYLATGTIGSTGKSARTPASHRLFDDEGKVIYDLRWDKGDLAKLMGSKVGIVGTVKEYEGWPHKVVVIERIDVLADEEDK